MPWKEAILGSSGGLQVDRVINGMRPGVRGQEFVVAAKAFSQVGTQAVVNGASVGKVGVHVAERDTVSKGRWIAGGIEALTAKALQDLLGEADTSIAARLG